MTEYLTVWRRWSDFRGRSRRREFWMYTLFDTLVTLALVALGFALAGEGASQSLRDAPGNVYAALSLVPTLAVAIRRLHDTGRTGWWLLVLLLPLVGLIALVVMLAQDSEGENRWGAPVKPAF